MILQQNPGSPTQQTQAGTIQIVQQIVTPSGEIQQIPVSLSALAQKQCSSHFFSLADSIVASTAADDSDAAPRKYLTTSHFANSATTNHSSEYGNHEEDFMGCIALFVAGGAAKRSDSVRLYSTEQRKYGKRIEPFPFNSLVFRSNFEHTQMLLMDF